MTHSQIFSTIFDMGFIFLAAAISLTYSISSRLTKAKRNQWWKLFVTAVLQIAVAVGVFALGNFASNLLFRLFNSYLGDKFLWVSLYLIVILSGLVTLKVLTHHSWRPLLKVWGVATALQIIVVPLVYFVWLFFTMKIMGIFYPSWD